MLKDNHRLTLCQGTHCASISLAASADGHLHRRLAARRPPHPQAPQLASPLPSRWGPHLTRVRPAATGHFPAWGSAANSLVAYLLGITRVDPIQQRLFLGRFLNEEMTSMPDIDIDIARDRRDEVLCRLRDYADERGGMP
ncbi:MAG TPA: hypothetical protein GX513_15485 [Firmicutes bacterium]|nr:hypothetical protein [Bacillota bacterium]